MKLLRFIVIAAVILSASPLFAAIDERFRFQVMGGGGWYNKEGDEHSDYAAGFGAGFQASEPISFETNFLYQPVGGDQYYFILPGVRYRFFNADFFMTPSLDFHGGVLIPVGDKTDIDGMVGLGGMLLYRTRWGVEFGPEVSANAVFEGSHIAVWVNYMGVVRFKF